MNKKILLGITKTNNGETAWWTHQQKNKIKSKQLEVQRAREHKIGTNKLVKKQMANTVAYPDLALEKLIGIDSWWPNSVLSFARKENFFLFRQ